MTTLEQQIWTALQDVKDPEIPTISVIEMGMVNRINIHGTVAVIEMLPTFVGCPALEMIRNTVSEGVRKVAGIEQVEVNFVFDPPWTSDRITPTGQLRLQEFGIALVKEHVTQAPPCPYCGSDQGEVENLFGPTACRAIYYCKKCRQPFEGMKKV